MVILLILFILILTLVASLVFRLMGISGRGRYGKVDLLVDSIRVRTDVPTAAYIDYAVADMRKSGLTPERIELTPTAYNWLCKELGRGCVTHVSGVPVKVIEPESAP